MPGLALRLRKMVTMTFLYGPEKQVVLGQKRHICLPCEVMMIESRNTLSKRVVQLTVQKGSNERMRIFRHGSEGVDKF